MQKRLILMRGPELVHNNLLHKQFGIVAMGGGRLRHGHYEMIRLGEIFESKGRLERSYLNVNFFAGIGRKLDINRMFAIWRIPAPWQPVTKKGQGQRMGGGKGAIDHYVTPVKAGRIIVEMGGKCEFEEVRIIKSVIICTFLIHTFL